MPYVPGSLAGGSCDHLYSEAMGGEKQKDKLMSSRPHAE